MQNNKIDQAVGFGVSQHSSQKENVNEDSQVKDEPSVHSSQKEIANKEKLEEASKAIKKLSEDDPTTGLRVQEMMMSGITPIINPIHEKVTPQHITSVLQHASEHDERQYELNKIGQQNKKEDKTEIRRYIFASLLVFVSLFAIILFLFQDKPNILIPIMTGLGGLFAGSVGGFGFGRSSSLK